MDIDEAYAIFKERLLKEPEVLRILATRKKISVETTTNVIELTDATLQGRLAKMIAEGFFDATTSASAAYTELRKVGFKCAKPGVYKECDRLTTLGFLLKMTGGYLKVPDAEINIRKAK